MLLNAVAVAALVVAATADTIPTVFPGKDDVVSDCPSFQWYACASCDESEYTVTIKSSDTGSVITKTSRVTTIAATPEDDSSLLDVGHYTWQVKQGNFTSAEIPFQICTKSCLPPKVSNKVDNTLASFVTTAFVKKLNSAKFQVKNNKSEIVEVQFTALPGSQILYLTHDANSDGAVGSATAQLKVSRGDNIMTLRYVFFSNHDQPIMVEILDLSNNVVRTLACINRDGSNGCQKTETPLTDEKWGRVMVPFDPLPEKATYRLRLSIEKESGMEDTVVALVNDIVIGQCSTLEKRNVISALELCNMCEDAGMYVPANRTCTGCGEAPRLSTCCASIDYCTACLSTSSCEATATSTCKSDAQCEVLTTRETCLDTSIDSKRKDCKWCPIDKKCFFHADYETNCSRCSSFSSSGTCPSSECQWCPISRRCVEKDEMCPSCNSISEPACTLANTDNECQYCTAKSECLQKDEECTQECPGLTTSSDCNTNTDCLWCPASEACTEKRIPCLQCAAMNLNSSCSSFRGCTYCSTGYCGTKNEKCPTCSGREPDVCTYAGGQTLSCKYCTSSQTCMDNATTCDTCSKVTDKDACSQHPGCTFCVSKNECQDSDETCEQCARLTMGLCAKFPAGCCWSQKDDHCHDYGSAECESGLSAAYIALIVVAAVVVVALIVVAIVVPICCCRKDKGDQAIVLSQTGASIVVLPEGETSLVAPESLQTVAIDPNAAPSTAAPVVSVSPADASVAPVTMMSQQPNQMSPADMQSMMAQQQQQMNVMMSSMLAQQQQMSAMMMNPMMMNSMGMNGMNGMNSMGMNGMSMNVNMMGTANVPAPPDQPGQVPPPPSS